MKCRIAPHPAFWSRVVALVRSTESLDAGQFERVRSIIEDATELPAPRLVDQQFPGPRPAASPRESVVRVLGRAIGEDNVIPASMTGTGVLFWLMLNGILSTLHVA